MHKPGAKFAVVSSLFSDSCIYVTFESTHGVEILVEASHNDIPEK